MMRLLDMTTYARIDHFRYFCGMANPYAGVTVNVDVSALVPLCKQQKRSFYLTMLHLAAKAANDIPQLRQRIHGDGICEYDVCATSHIELLEDGTYRYCTVHHGLEGEAYFAEAEAARTAARQNAHLHEDDAVDSLLFITCLPWLHYTALLQPVGGDSNPRISWGKYEEDAKGRLMLPVSLLVHHALVDGVHMAQFYDRLNHYIAAYCAA